MKYRTLIAVATVVCLIAAGSALAQDDDFPEYRPSPKIEMSKDEKAILGDQKETKKYLKLAVDLMESRLKTAEKKTQDGDYDEMLAELGGFHAIIDACLEFLLANEPRRGKVIDTFKRYEITLRGYSPRLENIRRDAPDKYGTYIIKLLKRVRENRAKAVESFYGDTVLQEN